LFGFQLFIGVIIMLRPITLMLLAMGVWVIPLDRQCTAQVVPYRTFGTGTYNPVTGDYGGSGNGTHVGRHTFSGNVITSPTGDPLVFDFLIPATDPQETVAANGDKIFFSGSGQVQLIPLDETFTYFSAVWSGTFVVEGGTGRFASVGPGPEPLDVLAVNDPFTFFDPLWSFRWELSGQISLR
jgi:hypothetical protein